MNSRVLLTTGLVLFGGAVYALHTDQMKTIMVCRDNRLYMDGGTDARLLAGGLNYRHEIKLFKRVNNKDVLLDKFVVTSETPSTPSSTDQSFLSGSDFKLSVFRHLKASDYGYPSHLDAKVKGEKISVSMACIPRNI